MKGHARLVRLLTETMNLTTTEAEGALRGVQAEAVARCGGPSVVIRRAFALRQYVSSRNVQKRYPSAQDKTLYALDRGYTGKRRVYVHDGKVVSHAHVDWHEFCERITGKR